MEWRRLGATTTSGLATAPAELCRRGHGRPLVERRHGPPRPPERVQELFLRRRGGSPCCPEPGRRSSAGINTRGARRTAALCGDGVFADRIFSVRHARRSPRSMEPIRLRRFGPEGFRVLVPGVLASGTRKRERSEDVAAEAAAGASGALATAPGGGSAIGNPQLAAGQLSFWPSLAGPAAVSGSAPGAHSLAAQAASGTRAAASSAPSAARPTDTRTGGGTCHFASTPGGSGAGNSFPA